MKFFRFWGPVVIWMLVIFVFSSRGRASVAEEYIINFLVFKTLHVLEYAWLFALSFRAVKLSVPHQKKFVWGLAALVVTVLYAASDELHQTYIPTREGTPRDVIIDAIGACIAWILIAQWLPKAPKKLRSLAGIWGIL